MYGHFNPQPKPQKKEKKPTQGLKRTPFKKKPPQPKAKPKKKEKTTSKKVDFSGFKIPPRSVRNEFSEKERKKALEAFGGEARCARCKMNHYHLHHIFFRSGDGRGVWRNGVPLCNNCHDRCHLSGAPDKQRWRERAERLYGQYYYYDEFDLWKAGLIEDPTRDNLESFMEQEAKKKREG